MSVWQIASEGIETASRAGGTSFGTGTDENQGRYGPAGKDEDQLKAFVDRITKWIPGDVLAIYIAGVTVLSAGAGGGPNAPFLMVMAVVALLVVLLAPYSSGAPITRRVALRAVLAVIAFLIWSLSVPLSGWQSLQLIAQNPGLVAVASAIAGLLFGLFAEGVVARSQG
jgi:hypothetical protein